MLHEHRAYRFGESLQDSVRRFETVAGRSAMIGFAVAVAAEVVLPRGGLFGGFDGALFSSYSTVALLAVCASAIVATLTKQRIGGQIKEVRRANRIACM